MKNQGSSKFFALLLAAALALGPALHAQPSTAAPVEKKTDEDKAVQSAPPAGTAEVAPADTSKPAQPTLPVPPAPPAAVPKPATVEPSAPVAGTTDATTVQPEKTGSATSAANEPALEDDSSRHHRHRSHGDHREDSERVGIFQDNMLAAGQQADAVVSVFGSSTSAGDVGDAVVSVFGSSTSSGEVGDAVVSILGNTQVTGGTVGDTAVAVFGNTTVNGHVRGDVVAVLGNVELGPNAIVDGQVVCVGGEVQRDPASVLRGGIHNIAIGGHHFNFDALHAWFSECVLYGRPLAFDTRLIWAWCIALALLGFYALLALLAPAGVTQCVQTLEERPGKSLLAALLVLLLTPVVYLLLVLTLALVIGFVLIPLLSLGLFLAGIFGRVIMLAWLGRRITKLFGAGSPVLPVVAVLVGGVIVLALYTVPVLGFIVYKVIGLIGLGVVLYTLLLSFKESRRKTAAANAASAAASASAIAMTAAIAAAPGEVSPVATPAVVAAPPPLLSAATLPRAGFWIRLGAVLLDCILAGMAFGVLRHLLWPLGGGFPLWFAVYNVVMWGTKGTTIGGIVCGIKIVRLDDRPLDWAVVVVRGLGGFLSLAVAGLGFIWVAFDREKQSWHDKIAGTTIVKVPKGTSLL